MLKIKLSRTGKNKQPSFRVVVKEAKSKRDGKYTDIIGSYNPLSRPKTIKIDQKAYQSWIAKGARPTPTVKKLYLKSK